MKNIPTNRSYSTSTIILKTAKPAAPVIVKEAGSNIKITDPSASVVREKYPIPSFFEYRMKPSEYDIL